MLKSAPARLAPKWFTSVMGTSIVANAAVTLPLHGLKPVAAVIWAGAAAWLLVLCWKLVKSGPAPLDHFWGAPPMAMLTIGAGALNFIGGTTGLAIDWTLWTAGTALGLFTTLAVPYRMITGRIDAREVSPTWLLPVVPPMVSATTGAALAAHLPDGQGKLALVLACYGFFGISLFATFALLPQIWGRLMRGGLPSPTLWIVLGPLGQSTTAALVLGEVAPAPYGNAARAFGLLYSVPTFGFAMLWLALAIAVTLKERPEFSLSWWAFTFPLGTCVTGASALSARTGSAVVTGFAVALYVLLVGLWLSVARKTRWRQA
ncbi:TDT family transporter [Amycolatopsis sp. cg5]|uniref:TDT family transporter n=1 Tax=Amycolatopsis sp. cg5 TaxID=3238802 RepID=UPI003524C4B0